MLFVAAGRVERLGHFRGKSTQLPFHEQFTHNNGLFSVKPSQGWSRLIKQN
jgi:hypothetical protein